jgi:hypothetical protein
MVPSLRDQTSTPASASVLYTNPSPRRQKTSSSDPIVIARSQVTTNPVDSSLDLKHSLQGLSGGLDPSTPGENTEKTQRKGSSHPGRDCASGQNTRAHHGIGSFSLNPPMEQRLRPIAALAQRASPDSTALIPPQGDHPK